jgi:two-component system, NtrC family, sensor kinase
MDDLSKRISDLEIECQRKQQELRDSQTQLVQVEKMAALGSLAAGLAHEINTPIAALSSNNEVIELAFLKLAAGLKSPDAKMAPDQIEELLSIISESIQTNRLACDRIIKFVKSVRNFARLDEADWKRADIEECLESTLTLLGHELKGRITVVKEFGCTPEIECYPNQLNQVFMNILVNAAQAISGPGEIRIRTWKDAENIWISISDNGPGIPAEIQSRIFDPGFTTKKAGLGTGLGLSICRKIIENHHGQISLESEMGRGSMFTIVLPIGYDRERKANGNTDKALHPGH